MVVLPQETKEIALTPLIIKHFGPMRPVKRDFFPLLGTAVYAVLTVAYHDYGLMRTVALTAVYLIVGLAGQRFVDRDGLTVLKNAFFGLCRKAGLCKQEDRETRA